MLNIIIFGPPGSGKGTQSKWIAREFSLAHISTGDVLRQQIQNNTDLGRAAAQYIDRGQLVPDALIIDILAHAIDSMEHPRGIIFDGFPRTLPQAEALGDLLAQRGTRLAAMLNLEVDTPELVRRLLERGRLEGRSDDNLETIHSRLDVYNAQTAPLIDYYRRQGILHPIAGAGNIENIFQQIKQTLLTCQTS
ncbi:MAG: adenylate kinase [Tannerellaceae bacterium]|nr:adenylate kinase [Tannerellaceae bacterium]